MQCADVYWGVLPVSLAAFCHIVLSASWFLPSPVMWLCQQFGLVYQMRHSEMCCCLAAVRMIYKKVRLLSQASAPKNFCLTFNLNYEKLIRGNLV